MIVQFLELWESWRPLVVFSLFFALEIDHQKIAPSSCCFLTLIAVETTHLELGLTILYLLHNIQLTSGYGEMDVLHFRLCFVPLDSHSLRIK